MRVVWAVLCSSYEIHDDGTADIFGAGFDAFQVESLPAELDLRVLAHLLMYEGEESELEIHLFAPGMTSVQTLSHRITADPGPLHRPGRIVAQTEAIEIPYEVSIADSYSIEVYAAPHGPDLPEQHHTLFFQVVEGLPEGA